MEVAEDSGAQAEAPAYTFGMLHGADAFDQPGPAHGARARAHSSTRGGAAAAAAAMYSLADVPRKRPLPQSHALFQLGDTFRSVALSTRAGRAVVPDAFEALVTHEPFPCEIDGCEQTFTSQGAFEGHYRNVHQNVCQECRATFPSDRLLTMHIMECHDIMFTIMAEKQPMYECLANGCAAKMWSRRQR